jgi:hypothetical protein
MQETALIVVETNGVMSLHMFSGSTVRSLYHRGLIRMMGRRNTSAPWAQKYALTSLGRQAVNRAFKR